MSAANPRRQISASRRVAVAPSVLYAQLADLRNHWTIAGGFVRVVEPDGDTATVELIGPAGLRRTARTRIDRRVPDREIEGTARLGDGTRASVRWRLDPAPGGGTDVTLSATVDDATALDRLVLALGAGVWMRRRFDEALARLDDYAGSSTNTGIVREPARRW